MSGIKWGVTAGIIASLVSVVLGIIFGVTMAYILIRAVLFLFIFFALGTGFYVIVNNYFPELMYMDEDSSSKITFDQPPGSQINITLGGIGEYAVPEMYRDTGDSRELGNIEDLISGHFKVRSSFESDEVDTQEYAPEQSSEGIDLGREEDYNTQSGDFNVKGFSSMPQEFESFREAEPEPEPSKPVAFEKSAFTPVFGSDDLGELPDLSSMATAFSTGFEGTEEAAVMPHLEEEADSSQMQYNKGNKPQPLKGDFNPKELAEGIRTVLKKD